MASNSDNMEFCPNDYDKFSKMMTNLNIVILFSILFYLYLIGANGKD